MKVNATFERPGTICSSYICNWSVYTVLTAHFPRSRGAVARRRDQSAERFLTFCAWFTNSVHSAFWESPLKTSSYLNKHTESGAVYFNFCLPGAVSKWYDGAFGEICISLVFYSSLRALCNIWCLILLLIMDGNTACAASLFKHSPYTTARCFNQLKSPSNAKFTVYCWKLKKNCTSSVCFFSFNV